MQDKIALITGAASGIGAAVARRLASQGARVALLDIDCSAGAALAAETGGLFIECNVADFDSMTAAVHSVCEQLGTPDFAHLNAGVMTVPTGEPFLAIEDVSPAQYQRIAGINLGGVFHGLKLLVPLMRDGGAAITITSSTTGISALPVDPLYAMTKYGLIGLVRSVAAANEESSLRLNVICPGVVDTAIVPDEFKAPEFGMMPSDEMAIEILDLMQHGANGEVRVRVKDVPGFSVPQQDQELFR
ncbi:MAG: SDR family oxidoreductase [Halieaceae bacterium]